jgi:hypothetical protein
MTEGGRPSVFRVRLWRRLVGTSVVLLGACWVAIAAATKDPLPLERVVHEDGRTTLLGTMLDVGHATRELPLDILLGLAVGAALIAFRPLASPASLTRRAVALASGAILVVGIPLAAYLLEGADALALHWTQSLTRPGAPAIFGAHWQYHLLSRAALLAGAWALPAALCGAEADDERSASARGLRLYLGTLGAFVILSLLFAPSSSSFVDARSLGHQAREVVTHGLITLPLALGVAALLGGPAGGTTTEGSRSGLRPATLVALALAGYVCLGALLTGATSEAQTESVVALVCVHVFEHAFSYVTTAAVATGTYLSIAGSLSMRSKSLRSSTSR